MGNDQLMVVVWAVGLIVLACWGYIWNRVHSKLSGVKEARITILLWTVWTGACYVGYLLLSNLT